MVAPTEQLSHRQVLRVLSGLMSGMFLAAIESTIVATAAPTIVEDLGGLDLITWVFTAYMLTTTVSAALWGKLSDLVGRRATYLAAISIFVAASLLAGAAQNMEQLILCRGLQGIGGGGLTALSFTIMADILAPRHRGRYVGYFSATYAAGSVVGPVLGGLLVDWFHWRVIFLMNLPLGLLAALVSASALRGVGGRRPARLDVGGALALSGAITCLLLVGVWGGNEYAWASGEIIGLALIGVVMLAAFVAIERRVAEPVIAIRLLRNRTLVLSMVIAALTTVPFNAAVVYLPLFLQTVHDASVSGSGLQLAPLMIMMSVGSIVSGRRVARTGRYKLLLYVGLTIGIGDAIWLSMIDSHTGTYTIVVMMLLLGLSFGITAPVVNLTAQNAMPVADLGAASSALVTFRSLGATIGIAGVGSVLLSRLRSGVANLPGGDALDVEAIASGPDTIARLTEPLRSGVVGAMAEAIATGMMVCVPLVLTALAVAKWLPELPLRDHIEIEVHEQPAKGGLGAR
ncbi:MAG: MDR family MFS transporter [Acidimicrobiia bacterium]